MYIVFGVIVILVAILLAFIVIIQNPKGGMLSSSFGSMGTQILGASRSTDAVEKITWGLAAALMLLSVASVLILPDGKDVTKSTEGSTIQEAIKNNKGAATTLPSAPMPSAPAQTAPNPNASAPATQQTPDKK